MFVAAPDIVLRLLHDVRKEEDINEEASELSCFNAAVLNNTS